MQEAIEQAAAHLWTLAPVIRKQIPRSPLKPAPGEGSPWSVIVHPEGRGPVTLTGRMHLQPGAKDLVLMLHGLGGGIKSGYLLDGMEILLDGGCSVLRMNLRGADLRGGDFYHGGLSEDVHAMVASIPQGDHERIWILGYSLGGHLGLRAATEDLDPQVAGVIAVSPPVDLAATQRQLDGARLPIYRLYVLSALKKMYGAIARRGEVPTPASRMRSVSTLLEWDTLTVAPRFGFESAADYYQRASVIHRIDQLDRPSLVLASPHDPFIPAAPLEAVEARGVPGLEIEWSRWAGHVGYPPGQAPEQRALSWMKAQM